jgi:probable rRNA maturation factor
MLHADVIRRVRGSTPPRRSVERLLRKAASRVGGRARGAAHVTVVFCGDVRMRRLNRQFRGVDQTTDVLSFPLGESAEPGALGDIVISVPAARRQARRWGLSPRREMEQLVLHGFLHLLGYDHEADSGEMDALELLLRRRLRIERPR